MSCQRAASRVETNNQIFVLFTILNPHPVASPPRPQSKHPHPFWTPLLPGALESWLTTFTIALKNIYWEVHFNYLLPFWSHSQVILRSLLSLQDPCLLFRLLFTISYNVSSSSKSHHEKGLGTPLSGVVNSFSYLKRICVVSDVTGTCFHRAYNPFTKYQVYKYETEEQLHVTQVRSKKLKWKNLISTTHCHKICAFWATEVIGNALYFE